MIRYLFVIAILFFSVFFGGAANAGKVTNLGKQAEVLTFTYLGGSSEEVSIAAGDTHRYAVSPGTVIKSQKNQLMLSNPDDELVVKNGSVWVQVISNHGGRGIR